MLKRKKEIENVDATRENVDVKKEKKWTRQSFSITTHNPK
jgi:hypothetical protein